MHTTLSQTEAFAKQALDCASPVSLSLIIMKYIENISFQTCYIRIGMNHAINVTFPLCNVVHH